MLALLLAAPALAGTIYSVDPSTDRLISFDTLSLTFTPVGALGFNFDFGGLAWHEVNNAMYIVGGRADTRLHTVDTSTGAATAIGTHGVTDMFGLAYDPNTGLLWGYSAATYMAYTLNTSTGAATSQFSIPFYAGGCDYLPGSSGIVCFNAGPGDWYLNATATTSFTSFAPTGGFLNNGAAAWDDDTQRVWTFDWSAQVRAYDPAAGMAITYSGTSPYNLDGSDAAVGGTSRFTLNRTSGTCPGTMSFAARNATPGGQVAFAYGNPGQRTTIPSGSCAGTVIPVGRAQLIVIRRAPGGTVTLSGSVPPAVCGTKALVAVDLSSCAVTQPLAL